MPQSIPVDNSRQTDLELPDNYLPLKSGLPKPNYINRVLFCHLNYQQIRFDEFGQQVVIDGAFVDDKFLRKIRKKASFTISLEGLPKDWLDAILYIADNYRFNWFVDEYLEQLQWDGNSRFHWLAALLSDNPTYYTIECVRQMFLQVIALNIDPDIVSKLIAILSGQQNYQKSRFVKALCPPRYERSTCNENGGIDGFSNSSRRRDFTMENVGKVMCELPELGAQSWKDTEAFKAYVSGNNYDFVQKYALLSSYIRRRCGFIGTRNPQKHSPGFINDTTGTTRFMNFLVPRPIDVDTVALHRDQIWAEVYALHKSGHNHYLSKEMEAYQSKHNEEFIYWNPDVRAAADELEKMNLTCVTMTYLKSTLRVRVDKNLKPQDIEYTLDKLGYVKCPASKFMIGKKDIIPGGVLYAIRNSVIIGKDKYVGTCYTVDKNMSHADVLREALRVELTRAHIAGR